MSTKNKIVEEVKINEPVYSIEELIMAAEATFKVKPEVVAAAMKLAGLKEATKDQAAAIIKKFIEKEVK